MLDPVVDQLFRSAAVGERHVGLRCLTSYWTSRTSSLYHDSCAVGTVGCVGTSFANPSPDLWGSDAAAPLLASPSPSGLLQELLRKERCGAAGVGAMLPCSPAPPSLPTPTHQPDHPVSTGTTDPVWLADVDWDARSKGPGREHSTRRLVQEVVAMLLSAACPALGTVSAPPAEALFHFDHSVPRFTVHATALRNHAAAAALPAAALLGMLERFAVLATHVATIAAFCRSKLVGDATGVDADGDCPMSPRCNPQKACLTVTFANVALGLLQEFQCCAIHFSLRSQLNCPPSVCPKGQNGSPSAPSADADDPSTPLTLAHLHCAMALERWPSIQVLSHIILTLQRAPRTAGVSDGVQLLDTLQQLCQASQDKGAEAQFATAHHLLVACLTPYLAMVDHWHGATPRQGNTYRGADWSLIQSRTEEWALSGDQYWSQCHALAPQQNIPALLQPLARRILTTSKAAHLLECIRVHGDPPPSLPRPTLAPKRSSLRPSRSRRSDSSNLPQAVAKPPRRMICDRMPLVVDHFVFHCTSPRAASTSIEFGIGLEATRTACWDVRVASQYDISASQWDPLRPADAALTPDDRAKPNEPAEQRPARTEGAMDLDVPSHNPIFDVPYRPYDALDVPFDPPCDVAGSTLEELLRRPSAAPANTQPTDDGCWRLAVSGWAQSPTWRRLYSGVEASGEDEQGQHHQQSTMDVLHSTDSAGGASACTDAVRCLQPPELWQPLTLALEFPIREAVDRCHAALNPRLLRVIVDDYRLPEYFEALRRYWLMGQGDVMRTFTEAIFDRIATKQEWWSPAGLQDLWQACVVDGASVVDEYATIQPFADPHPSDPTARSRTQSIVCLSGLGFHLVPEFPINLVLSAADIEQYNAIFGFLVQLHYVKHSLEHIRIPAAMAGGGRKEATPHHRLSHFIFLLRSRMLHATNGLVQYFFHRLDGLWRALMDGLAAADDVDGLRALHTSQLQAMVAGCLLAPQTGPVKAAVDRLLDSCLELRRRCEAYVERALLLPRGADLPTEELQSIAKQLGKVQQRFDNAHTFLIAVLQKVRRTERDPSNCLDELYTRLNFNRFYDQRLVDPLW